MVLSVSNICKSFLEVPVLKDVSFHIEDYEKAAIVGINGAGKTTLLKIITHNLQADDGVIAISKDKTIGYLAQNQDVSEENTIYNELLLCLSELLDCEKQLRDMENQMNILSGEDLDKLMDAYTTLSHKFDLIGGYTYKSEISGILKGLGFNESDFDQKISTLSGGQKTRVALGKLLLEKPNLIILDEPTNHLDISSIEWLETYLKNYKGAVLIVSHDRFFLDKIATKIIELDNCKATVFTGNYTDYISKKEIVQRAKEAAFANQQAQIAHQQAVIDKLKSFNREKSIKRAESREKMLDKIELLEKPTQVNADMKLVLEPEIQSGNDVLSVDGLSKSFGSMELFSNQSFEIKRGEHVAIIGVNGTGKTTLLKMLNGLESIDSGSFKLGTNVEIGYYDQEHHVLHDEKTLFDEISDAYPNMTNTKIRNTLAAFLFTGDDAFKKIKDLSGGEKGRMSLAKLMLSNANFLILDEPTNHLDIISKEILENALNSYTGTVLYVSHDRYFVNRTATRILELNDHNFVSYIGNYDYYLDKKYGKAPLADENKIYDDIKSSSTIAGNLNSDKPSDSKNAQGAADYKAQKEEAAKIRKIQNEINKCEETISKFEERKSEVETMLSDPSLGNDLVKLTALSKENDELEHKLMDLYYHWEQQSDLLSQYNK